VGTRYVPQEYLRGFATANDRDTIWMFDRRRRTWSRAAIDKVAQQREYFLPEIETILANEVETPGNRALNRLRAGRSIDAGDRRSLAIYVAIMTRRVPRRRRKAQELVPSTLRNMAAELRQELRDLLTERDPARLAALLLEVDRVEAKFLGETPQNVLDEIRQPWVSADMLNAIDRMAWRFVARPERASPFITCDNPAFFFEFYGVGRDESELTFPISPDLALMGSHQGEAGSTMFIPTTRDIAKEINRRVVSDAERFIFSPQRAKWIEALAARRNPYLSRMRW
jgi:hypothetical protein